MTTQFPRLLTAALILVTSGLPAQEPNKAELALRKKAASLLTGYAAVAVRNKVATRAKEAYEEVVRRYTEAKRG